MGERVWYDREQFRPFGRGTAHKPFPTVLLEGTASAPIVPTMRNVLPPLGAAYGRVYRTRWPICHRQIVWLPPVFELVAARCHWHLAFKWVRVPCSVRNEKHHPLRWCFSFLVEQGTRTCDLMRVKRRGAMPHGGRSNQQSFSTIFTVILEKSELFLEILS